MPPGRLAVIAAGLAAVCACQTAAGAEAAATAAPPPGSGLVVFYDGGAAPAAAAGLSLGLVSAAQLAGYSREQFLLDAGQGARAGGPGYGSPAPPRLTLSLTGGGGAQIAGWDAARRRAASAAGRLQPGLLAASVPGGAAYAGAEGSDDLDAALAAGRAGRIAAVSIGGERDLPARIATLLRTHALVVADLPAGAAGRADLARLTLGRRPGELIVALQRAPAHGELLWAGVGGLSGRGGPGELESGSTEQRGLISSVDLGPTLLAHLGLPVPAAMQGRTIVARGDLDTRRLQRLAARLRAIPGRRLPALALLLAACALMVLACARRPGARRFALRSAALALLWAPCAALAAAAIEPGATAEYALIGAVALALGAASDLALRWPRALTAPAVAVPLAIALDALAGTQLQMRSLAGPDPIGGARFFGIGNELKSALAAMALVGVAAALYPPGRDARRRAAGALLAAGMAMLVVEGWARIGAGVGGAVLVSAAFGLAAAIGLGPTPRGRRAWLAPAGAAAGLAALVAIDELTARGRGHLQGSLLDARSFADVRDQLADRYATAWNALRDPAMAAATAVSLALAAAGVRLRALLRPVGGEWLFAAAFAGGLLGGIVGALVEDSGPLLLVEAVFVLACAAVYLHAQPAPRAPPKPAVAPYASSSAAPSTAAERPTIAVLGGSHGSA